MVRDVWLRLQSRLGALDMLAGWYVSLRMGYVDGIRTGGEAEELLGIG